MPVSPELTTDLKKVVLALEDDLRQRVESQTHVREEWQEQHREAVKRERTAMSWQAWRDDRVTQASVAWVLTTVFIRFCEDNSLLKPVWLAGPPARRQEALDAELAYFREHPEDTAREWIRQAIAYLATVNATKELVEEHSPLWLVSPSGQAAKDLVEFWRAKTDNGELIRDFTDPDLSTRFLGDLYQDLSDYAKKTFALLQTPEFVEEFILDQTMEPALAERPLEGFMMIDPTCGSGHFLLGAFARLNDKWAAAAPGLNSWDRVQKALDAVHGVDLNPFAVAIARFRLIVAALKACGLHSLEEAPGFRINLAAGDSLLHGRRNLTDRFDQFDDDAAVGGFVYETEDLDALRAVLTPGRYDVVVGNPPYITVKDKTLNQRYRNLYETCKGKYALTVPFMERFFELGKRPSGDEPAGWVGQITSNSFMKREFGSSLIEEFLSKQDLRLVVDTSGAYIPGHGTPTVIIVGRHSRPSSPTVRAVLGKMGEPGRPTDPAKGRVWTSIAEGVTNVGAETAFTQTLELPRSALSVHPWSLSGGGTGDLLEAIEATGNRRVGTVCRRIGFFGLTGFDDLAIGPRHAFSHAKVRPVAMPPFVSGEEVRDWAVEPAARAFFPYRGESLLTPEEAGATMFLWPYRSFLGSRRTFSGRTYLEEGRSWWKWHQLPADIETSTSSITFAAVATHNHFCPVDEPWTFGQSAPLIKFPKNAAVSDIHGLLGLLNASVACFWLKQKCHNKGSSVDAKGARQTLAPWEDFYDINSTNVGDIPLPPRYPSTSDQLVDGVGRDASLRIEIATRTTPTKRSLDDLASRLSASRRRNISLQEELDWEVYRLYSLIDDDLTYPGEVPEVALGERAFEIALARKVAAGEEQTAWFSRHGSKPVTDIPAHWPADYRDLIRRRLDLIESNKFVRLLEKPEYKRRWASEPWDKQVDKALGIWLLDRLEDRAFWFDQGGRPMPRSIGQLADLVARDADLVSVLELWSGKRDQSVATSLTTLLIDEAVPFLAAYRLKDSGLRKRQAWEHTWALQRREDAGTLTEAEKPIPVPPKYTSADFRKASWWQARGKLDVPKERFVLYPDAGRETDPTLVLGWAGWDHAEQFLALATLLAEREAEGWADDKLVPLVAGLAELMPWVRQWHDEVDATYGVNMADFCDEQLRDRAAQVGKTIDQLKAWRPAAPTRGRRAKSTA